MKSARKVIEEKLAKGQNVLIFFVGDSITWGISHVTDEETYTACVARHFAKRYRETTVVRYDGIANGDLSPLAGYSEPIVIQEGTKGKITVVRCGIGGNTVRRAINRKDDYMGKFITDEEPDIYVSMFGINDALFEDPSKYVVPEQFEKDLREYYDILCTNQKAVKVFMTPTWNDDGDKCTSCLEPYSDKVKLIAKEKGLQCIDTHALWMSHLKIGTENYGQRDWLSNVKGDKCHFSAVGSTATADFIFNELCGLVL